MTPEGKVKDMVKKQLNEYGVYYYMPVSNGMGAPSLDFYCCYRGQFFAIETKAPGKKLTHRQRMTEKNIRDSGGEVFMVDDEATMSLVIAWLAGQALRGCSNEPFNSGK